ELRCQVKLARPLRAKLLGKGPRVAAPYCPQTPGIATHYDPSSRTGKTPSGSRGRHSSHQGNSARLQPSSTALQEGRRLPLGGQCEARQATELPADRLHSALLRFRPPSGLRPARARTSATASRPGVRRPHAQRRIRSWTRNLPRQMWFRFVRDKWHEGPAILTVLILARLWFCLAITPPSPKGTLSIEP